MVIGVGTHFGAGLSDPLTVPGYMKSAGVRSYRDDAYWSMLEKSPGVYAWPMPASYLYTAVFEQQTVGLEPMIILGVNNKMYDGGGMPVSDAAQAAFVKYAVYVATKFKGKVFRYELENEWNAYNSPQGDYQPAAYVRLLKKVYPALKAVDPNIIVVAGASVGAYWAVQWNDAILAAGAAPYMDRLSVHAYYYWAGVNAIPERAFDMVSQTRALLQKYSPLRDIPIYISEIGWSTFTGNWGVDQATQADYLTRFYLISGAAGYVRGVWWYDLQEDGADLTIIHNGFGTMHGSTPKPAYCALTQVTKLLDTSKALTIAATSGVHLARMPQLDGSFVYAVWQEAKATTNSVLLTAQGQSTASFQVTGNCKSASSTPSGSAALRVTAGQSPIFIKTNASNLVITSVN
jgi:hypothetical protein